MNGSREIADVHDDLTPADFLVLSKKDGDWQLLDVRDPWEREIASVAGSIDIPMAEIPARLGDLDADRPVAVLCHSGGRSARVAAFLVQQGFVRVANIAGGIDAWAVEVDERIARY